LLHDDDELGLRLLELLQLLDELGLAELLEEEEELIEE